MIVERGSPTLPCMGLLRTLAILEEADRIYERRYGPGAGSRPRIYFTSGTRGSGSIDAQSARTRSRAGSKEHAMVRVSPASALR
jgi:hypothetical protein